MQKNADTCKSTTNKYFWDFSKRKEESGNRLSKKVWTSTATRCRSGQGARVRVGMLRGAGDFLTWKVSWFFGLLASWFLGVLFIVYWLLGVLFLGCYVYWFRGF